MGTLNDTLTQQLRHIRTQKEMSIEVVAQKLGMSPDSYAKIENGETPITLDSVESVAEALEASVSQLLNTHPNVIFSGELSHTHGCGCVYSNAANTNVYVGVSSDVLEKLLQRIDTLETELANSREQQ